MPSALRTRPVRKVSRPAARKSQGAQASVSNASRSAKLARWGNSLGIRIPREYVEQLHMRDGESVRLEVAHGCITLRPARRRKRWSEAELLAGVTPAITGPELWPIPAGKERF